MTDSEIIKALDRCIKTEYISDCAKCEMFAFDCKDKLIFDALSLITRQKAEIEKVKSIYNSFQAELDCAKSEARREFAEKIHKHCTSVELNEYIDTLIEEMESESDV